MPRSWFWLGLIRHTDESDGHAGSGLYSQVHRSRSHCGHPGTPREAPGSAGQGAEGAAGKAGVRALTAGFVGRNGLDMICRDTG